MQESYNYNFSPKLPGVLINTLPKSGSIFIRTNLAYGLNLQIKRICPKGADWNISPTYLETFVKEQNVIVQNHFPATYRNLTYLKKSHVNKFVVHFRDPRQAMISHMFYWIKDFPAEEVEMQLQELGVPVFWKYNKFCSLSLEAKIDLCIHYLLPQKIKWISDWLEIKESDEWNFDILFTSFNDMKKDYVSFINSILDFYGIERQLWKDPKLNKSSVQHFRKGKINEWKDLLSPYQQKNC